MPTLDSNEKLDDILDRFRRGCDTDFDVSIRYGRTKEETKQALLVREKQLIEAAVREARIDENHRLDLEIEDRANTYLLTGGDVQRRIVKRIASLNQPTKEEE